MEFKIAVIKGDGIGPEVVDGAIEILDAIGHKYGHKFIYDQAYGGGAAYDKYGHPLPQETIDICKANQAVLFGAVGGPKWDQLAADKRPERAILGLRKELGLYANLRPGIIFPALKEASPLKDEIIGQGFDILVVRELTGGIYFGESGRKEGPDGISAYDIESYSQMEIERIAHTAFEMAGKRKKKVTSVDKSNVLESSKLWRETVSQVAKSYPEIEIEHIYVDNAAMQLVRDPGQFDVLLTSNLFGDILSDEISMITGSIGLLPSASIGSEIALYEPIHGTAPDIAGQGIANPIATILSAAMMLRFSFDLREEADQIERAVEEILQEGYRSKDIARDNENSIGTDQMVKLIKEKIQN